MYEEVEEELKFITTSGVRIKMMISLLEKPKTSRELKDELKLGVSTIIHSARDLEKENILVEKIDGYHLTTVGKLTAIKLMEIIKFIKAIKRGKEFWKSHIVDNIPEKFLRKIYKLYDHKILTSSIRDVFKTLSVYIEITKRANKFYGVSPILVEAFIPLIKKLLKRETEIKLVITEEILEELKKLDKEGLREVIMNKNLSLWTLKDTPKVAFTVTDKALFLGLFDENGVYDPTQDLVSYNKEAIEWGRELFEYYKSKARKVNLEDI